MCCHAVITQQKKFVSSFNRRAACFVHSDLECDLTSIFMNIYASAVFSFFNYLFNGKSIYAFKVISFTGGSGPICKGQTEWHFGQKVTPRERRERSHFYISSSRSRFYTTVTSLPIWSFLPPPEYAKHCSPLDDVIEQLANEEWACVLPVELNSAIGDGITSLAIFWLYLKRAIFNTVHIYIQ